jgi:hypothetical protein
MFYFMRQSLKFGKEKRSEGSRGKEERKQGGRQAGEIGGRDNDRYQKT